MSHVAPTAVTPVMQLPPAGGDVTPRPARPATGDAPLVPLPGPSYVKVAAHRGVHGEGAPVENTLAAVRAAIELGADTVETDVHRTADGVLVLVHDPDIDGVEVASTRYADLPLVGGEPVPTLAQVADLVAGSSARLMAELKAPGFEREAVDTVAARLPFDQFALTSFDTPVVQAIEAYRPEVDTGLLSPRIFPWMRENPVFRLVARLLDPLQLQVRRAEKAGADMIAIDRRTVTDRTLDNAAARGIDVAVWTVNDHDDIRRFMADARIATLITDEPAAAIQARDAAALAAVWPAA